MLERMYETCDCCDAYFFDERIEAVDEDLIDDLYTDLNMKLSEFWCGQISLLTKYGSVIGYEYMTEFEEELERIDDIKADITEILKTFQLSH